ncbi:MAG: hypothetical protein N3A59_06665 [Thermodesulfovibrionales bacterium]|nr:hypothetical protein [Thermodesulfovibrionales bacterium]
MSYIVVLKDGIKVINSCWQLVLLHLLSAVISFISFFLIVGMPISIAFIVFGLDLTEILRAKDIYEVYKSSVDLLKRYFAMAIVIITSLLVYFTIIFTLWLFTVAGSLGTITEIIKSEIKRYTNKVFFSQGRKLFFPIFGYSSLIGLILVVLAFVLGILGGGISSVIEVAQKQEAVLALFLSVFFSIIIFITGIFLIFIILSITVYGIAEIIFHRSSPFKAFRETVKYIYNNPSSVLFYSLLLIGSVIVIFIVILLGSPIILIPFLGPILSPLFQIASTLVQAYINLVVFASAFVYYYKTAIVSTTGDDSGRMSSSSEDIKQENNIFPLSISQQDQTQSLKES